MSITQVSSEELHKMQGKEGLIIQSCGGSLQKWQEDINKALTEEILLNGSSFQDAVSFEHDGLTNMLFLFDDNVKLDVRRLAVWRLKTHDIFGGTWLSDYVQNKLDGYIENTPSEQRKKPDCPLIGEDGNIFNLMGIAARTLRENDMPKSAKDMCNRIYQCGSYREALSIIDEYVNITSVEDMEDEMNIDLWCSETCVPVI